MPEMRFLVRWPDGSEQSCYSPSSVVTQHFQANQTYALTEFLQRSRTALQAASARVQEKFGMPCSRALAQLADIESQAGRFLDTPEPRVTVLAFHA